MKYLSRLKKLFPKRVSQLVPASVLPVLLLILIETILFLTNYKAGTYLIGWDNIMPEFNLSLNMQRSLTSLWQEYRGLGALDGMSHAATLFHTIYIWLLSFVLPQDVLRYFFIHLTHLLGGIGMFYFLKYVLRERKRSHVILETKSEASEQRSFAHAQDDNPVILSSFLGALFYMFNIGIIQMYFAPLEVFATHFAALPFLSLQLLRTFANPRAKNLLVLFLLSAFFSPQGFVPTVFIAFLLLFGILTLAHLLQTRQWKTIVVTSAVVFLGNAFWLLPFVYSVAHTPAVIQNTKINQLASDEIFYRNKAYGDMANVFSLKGFMLATVEYDTVSRKDTYFMQRWVTHTDSFLYKAFFFLCFLTFVLGTVTAVKKKKTIVYPFLAAGAVSFVFLANNTPGLEQLNLFIRNAFPLFGEAFRFPFTKFITLFAFCFSLFFSVGVAFLLTWGKVYTRQLIILCLIILSFLSFPAFQGYFTSPYLRLPLPDEYRSVMTYMQTKDRTARVALLPVHTFWNWQYRTWGHRGSGFLWYGLPQPILERAFDPWSLLNEQYYSEISAAYNRQDSAQFTHVLQKYNITYIILDETLLNSLSPQPIDYDALKTFLTTNSSLKQEAQFGQIRVYKMTQPRSPVTVTPTYAVLRTAPDHISGRTIDFERAFPSQITYMESSQPTIAPLFPVLTTEKLQEDIRFSITRKPSSIVLSRSTNFSFPGYTPKLTIPSLFETEFLVPIAIEKTDNGILLTPLYPEVRLNHHDIPLHATPLGIKPTTVLNPTTVTFTDIKHTISITDGVQKSYLLNPYRNTIKLSDGAREELIIIDTNHLNRDALIVPVQENHISFVEIEIPTFLSPLAHTDLITRGLYNLNEITNGLPSITGKRMIEGEKTNHGVQLSAVGTKNELSFFLDNLYHQGTYLLFVNNQYQNGLPVNYYIDNTFQKKAEIQSVLSKKKAENVIVLPKTENFYQGYGFHFTVKSVGNERAQSTINDIDIYPFPQETIARALLTTPNLIQSENGPSPTPLPYTMNTLSSYTVDTVPADSVVMLSQAFDPGWKAYVVAKGKEQRAKWYEAAFPFIFGKEITEHTKVNNWANGWVLSNETMKQFNNGTILIVYLPQYLQYIGISVTIITFLSVGFITLRGRRRA